MNSEKKWWQAVLDRDPKFDGHFFYAVRSTGIYCRPTCPSRRPHSGQVLFFTAPLAAEQAGFRPCRRCRPAEPISSNASLVHRACNYIEENHTDPIRLADLSRRFKVSSSHLQRLFKSSLGVSPAQYLEACRMKAVKVHLQRGRSVTEALYEAGFGSSSRLYERAPSLLGMTPATYGRGGAGMRISYATVACPLGRLLIAATSRGLCAVSLGNSDGEMAVALKKEYPNAEIFQDKDSLSGTIAIIIGHLNGNEPRLDFPLDVRATAFQCRVWEELRRIPYGTTQSYSEIARRIGRPKAARAVARACATNAVALVIPCHRVVAQTGELAGYRWGQERKQALLAREQKSKAK